jgi:hypothetical protein
VGAAGAAWAGPLDKRFVGAEATWVIHVDLEAALSSTVGKLMLEDEEALEGLRELKSEFGIDFRNDVKGVTLWGREAEGEDAVVVVHATAVVDELLEHFREEAGLEEIEAGGYELLRCSDGGESCYAHVRRTRHGDDRIVFISRSEKDLVRGLEVADGDEASAAGAGAIIRDEPGEGAFLFVSIPEIATLVPGEALGDVPAVFGMIQGVRLEAGERGGELFADAAVTAESSENALMVSQAANGLIAIGKMLAGTGDEPELAEAMKFADKLKIASKDRTVTFSLRCDAGQVREMIAQIREEEEKEERRGAEVKVEVEVDDGDKADRGKGGGDSPVAPPDKPRRKRGS